MRFLLVILLLMSSSLFADLKFRAREHFDIHDIARQDKVHRYFGLSNTLNFGIEERNRYYYAISLNPMLGSSRLLKSANAFYGEEIILFMVGVEAKKHWEPYPVYARLGLGWTKLFTDTNNEPNGASIYAGIGYEWEFYEGITMVPELGTRFGWLEDNTTLQTATFSLGFHFYNFSFFRSKK